MSLVIAVFAVIIVAVIISRYYPHQKPANTLAEGEILIPDVEEPVQEVVMDYATVIEPLVDVTIEAPKMDAKPKKKQYHKKKPKPNK